MATWHIRNSPCGRRQSTPRQLTCACEQGIYPRKQCESQLTSREDRDRNGQREPEVYSQREGGSLDMRTFLRSKVTLLFLAFAVAIFAVTGTAMALTTDGSGTTSLSPTIQSDKEDYAPGSTVTLTGS